MNVKLKLSFMALMLIIFSYLFNYDNISYNYITKNVSSQSLAINKSPDKNYSSIVKLDVSSDGIKDGIISPQYGAASTDKLGVMPLESIPLQWSNGPVNTQAYAITIIDYDTIPIIGFPWIHWIVSDIPANITSLPSNSSTTMASTIKQGVTSYADGYLLELKDLRSFQVPREKAFHYGGMVPINFPHKYTITVFALDTKLNLENGFGLNDLYNLIDNHIVGYGVIYGIYNAYITSL